MKSNNDLILRAIRLAEYAHRTRHKGPHYRKAPEGEDRPSYFVHCAEVAYMFNTANYGDELIAAGYLHDVIEDCDYTADELEEAIDNRRVRDLVEAVSETDKSLSWEDRNGQYLERMKTAEKNVLLLSCADKAANLMEMCRWLEKGYSVDSFTSRGHQTQLQKFEAWDGVYRGKIDGPVYDRFRQVLDRFKRYGDQ